MVAIYNDAQGQAIIRVWDALTGIERTVTYDSNAQSYLATDDISNISTLTLADYTLIANKSSIVSLSEVDLTERQEEERSGRRPW